MSLIKAKISEKHYLTSLQNNDGSVITADEPISDGGEGAGFSPTDLLASSLAACTSITLRMYADRKQWKLDGVEVDVALTYEANVPQIKRIIKLLGDLNEEQQKRLLEIANHCPIHKLLTNSVNIQTEIAL